MSETTAQITLELVDKLTKGLNEVNTKLDAIGTHAKNAEASSKTLGDTLKNIANIAGLAFISKQIFSIGKAAIDTAGQFEQFNVAFSTMLGSSEKAKVLMNDIKNFAATTPFQLPEIVEGAKKMVAYNIATKDIIPTLSVLGNVASALGTPMSQLTDVFLKVKSNGKLMGQEMMRFADAGINMKQLLADSLGKTTTEIAKMSEKGQISFAMVSKALEKVGGKGGVWGNLMIEQSKTIGGVFSNISDTITQVMLEIGNAMLPVVKYLAINFLGALMQIREWFSANQEGIKSFFFNLFFVIKSLTSAVVTLGSFLWEYIIRPLVEFVMSPVVKTILAIVAAMWLWNAATVALTVAQAALATVNPLAWVAIAVVGVIAAFNLLKKHWGEIVDFLIAGVKAWWRNFTTYIGIIIKLFTGDFKGAFDDLKRMVSEFLGIFTNMWNKITGLFSKKDKLQAEVTATTQTTAVNRYIAPPKEAVAVDVEAQKRSADAAKEAANAYKQAFLATMKGGDFFQLVGQAMSDQILQGLVDSMFGPLANLLGGIGTTIGETIKTFFLKTMGFQQFFTTVMTQIGTLFKVFNDSILGQFLTTMAGMVVGVIGMAVAFVTSFALMAASAAAAAVAMIPIVGPVLAIGAYFGTLALVMGGLGKLVGLAYGTSEVVGGNSGDTVPAMLTPGEMVIPKTMAEGIRSGEVTLGEGASGGATEVIISLKNDAINFIEAQIVKRNRLGGSAIAAG